MLLEIRRDIANSFPTSQFQREAELTTPKNLISDYDIGKIPAELNSICKIPKFQMVSAYPANFQLFQIPGSGTQPKKPERRKILRCGYEIY